MTKKFENLSQLVLGTSQIGSNYGVTNKNTIDEVNAREIINFCNSNFIKEIDTAIDYANSEKILGNIGVSKFSISTKLPNLKDNISNIESWIDKEINESLRRLNLPAIKTLYLHNPSDLRTKYGEKIYKKLEQLKNEKLINNIGISVYTPSTLINIINEFKIDVVQFPLNILDNRFNTKYIHDELESQSINIYLRSIFLQGLLVTKSINHHNYFSKWKFIFLKWENWLNQNKLSPVDVCVNYALSVFKKAKVIVGVSSLNDLREISVACDQNIPHIPKEFWCSDIELVDPRKWKI